MSKPFCILHISDLHRSHSDPISNDELISALVGDRDRYIQENPRIPVPEAIVVSGDIIQGVPLGTANYESELEKQYDIAEKFLDELVKRFLSGDRSRVVIVPGNHDVDWNTAFSAMTEIEQKDLTPDFAPKLFTDNSEYRWDWKKRKAYRIEHRDLYAKRLNAFWTFFEKFYLGVPGLLKVQAGSDANLFSLNDGKIGIAAFNSCDGNDCFAYHGMIRKEVVARSHLELQDAGIFDLLIAVWHHNIEGAPYRTDYMDIDIVRGMIGRGFRLGLYGHQHKAQVAPHQIWLPDRERMAVVCAGSLCAGRNELPTGITRQYNILEIAEDMRSVRVHVREMSIANLFSRGRLVDLGGSSFSELNWVPPKNSAGGIVNNNAQRLRTIIDNAEIAVKTGNPSDAVELLNSIELPAGSYERTLFLTAAANAKNWQAIIKATNPPTTIEELLQRFDAFININDYSSSIASIDKFSRLVGLPSATEADLRQRISVLKKMII